MIGYIVGWCENDKFFDELFDPLTECDFKIIKNNVDF